jgi:hypothetical protein
MTRGYPTETEIDSFLAARGLEIVPENASPWILEFKRTIWGLMNRLDWPGALAVYCATTTTFNVAGGTYNYKGEVKTYTPGNSINPTDNDTTYIWLNPDNTIGSGIDGNGWPVTTEYIKLAEIDVDSEGIITAIRDLRGESFLHYSNPILLLASVDSVDLNTAATTNLYTVPTGKKMVVDHIKIRKLSANATSTVVTLGKSTAKTDFLAAQTLSNLSAAGKAGKLMPVPNATPLAIVEYAAGEIFVIDVTTAAGIACTCTADVFGTLADA